jgi:hypothetical protein
MEPERGIINHSLSLSFQLYICLPCVHILVRYVKIVFQKDSQHIYFIPAHVASKTIKQRELLRLIDDVSCGGEWSCVVANLWVWVERGAFLLILTHIVAQLIIVMTGRQIALFEL